MDTLSPETFEYIMSLIPREISEKDIPKWDRHTLPGIPGLATVSRRFQRAIERRTFHWLHIEASDTGISEFESILSSEERRSHIRQLLINLPVPPRPSKATTENESESESEIESQYETNQDRQAHKEVLTAPLRRLWNFLGTWNEGGIYLRLGTDLPPDVPWKDRPFAFSLLDLTADVESFPALPCISEFSFGSHSRHWNPRVALVLTSKMPNLERAEWLNEALYDWGRYYSIDKIYRDELVRSIQTKHLPSSLKKFSCQLKVPSYDNNHTQPLPRFIEDGAYDPVSCAIRQLTRLCTDISLEGPFHPSLFDPAGFEPAVEEPPCWQHTTELNVKVLPCSPDGSWLLRPQVSQSHLPEGLTDCTQLPPGYADTEEGREEAENYCDDHEDIVMPPKIYEYSALALVPDDEKLNAMIVAFARCCARMPTLKIADVRFEDNGHDFPYQISFIAAFYRVPYWDTDMANSADSCRIYLHFNDWRPADATIAELKNVGVEKYGQPSTIAYLDWGYYFE
ncbi:hypothetical protein EV127DRAFT_195972 [Xylaria flabelliformis]|nr:hypothetical protein EV127DRAFT_195972 [Xylaria flabelliformis]